MAFHLMLTCIFCIAATALFSYHWAALVFYSENLPYHKRIVWAALRVVLGLLLIGVFLQWILCSVILEHMAIRHCQKSDGIKKTTFVASVTRMKRSAIRGNVDQRQ